MAAINAKTGHKVEPMVYAYTTPTVPEHRGWTKIGYTERDVETRIAEQLHTANIPHRTEWALAARYVAPPIKSFTDHDFHRYLVRQGVPREKGTEWFQIDPMVAKGDFFRFITRAETDSDNIAMAYTLRAEQEEAVSRALSYFRGHDHGEFLWNCKPRFGKTLSTYDLAKRMGARRVLVVTNRPAIAQSWYDDYMTFLGPDSGYDFVSNVSTIKDLPHVMSYADHSQRVVKAPRGKSPRLIEFVSLQDLKGSLYFGGAYRKLEELCGDAGGNGRPIGLTWDLLVIDEAHEGVDTYKTDVAFDHIARRATLHLSGTPFKALASEKFAADAIYNWTYADEQGRKRDCQGAPEGNPYENLPRLTLYTYQMSDIVRDKAQRGVDLGDKDVEEYAFDLNEFFATKESGRFVYEDAVDKFLDALTTQDKFPFSTPELRGELRHTFWLLDRVASAKELARKLRLHPTFKDYEVIVAAGDGKVEDDEAVGQKALERVREAIKSHDRTITLSVGQLTTGVTVPEWTAVLMLCNMKSPALYMQAAFRAQNPCLFQLPGGESYRKTDSYVFDFDPARTLDIYEQFANDLSSDTAGGKGDGDAHKRHIKELLNFFPVYGEDDSGSMVELDAERVLSIPRRIRAREVVDRGFMSNFLFANVSNIFGAGQRVIDLINGMQAIEEPKKLGPVDMDEHTGDELGVGPDGSIVLEPKDVEQSARDLFGDKVYQDLGEVFADSVQEAEKAHKKNPDADELERLKKTFSKPVATQLVTKAKEGYGSDMRKSTQTKVEKQIQATTDSVVQRHFGDYTIQRNKLEAERKERVAQAQVAHAPSATITAINDEIDKRQAQAHSQMLSGIAGELASHDTVKQVAEGVVATVETAKREEKRNDIMGDVRDHLRGFSRTIPSFLMAYGSAEVRLASFDTVVPADVFVEVTGITLDDFRFLRDGGDWWETDADGRELRDEDHRHHFEGHLFDEVVFDDAVREFLDKRERLADYFAMDADEDIFDYIPPQRTNQIFTPKKVVQEMVDLLEQENPGCFDDPDKTFVDLYMKSGLYVAELAKRLFRSKRMRELYPNDEERLRHIFERQLFGLAPTQIIYRIARSYVLGWDVRGVVRQDHLRLLDVTPLLGTDQLQARLDDAFGE